jgi:long-chain-fatty-acid---luciferin-component ligase
MKMHEILGSLAVNSYLFRASGTEQANVKFKVITKSFNYHYENNEYYRELCKASNVMPSDLKDISDFIKIPLIPMKTFKLPDPGAQFLLNAPADQMEMQLTSSGTGGNHSCARRDSATVTNLMIMATGQYREFLKVSNGAALFLAPSPGEVPEMANLGMIKTFTIFSGEINACGYAVENKSFSCEKAVKLLKQWEGKLTRFIFGPPFLLNSLCDYLIENNIKIKLDSGSKIVTIGGWKRNSGAQISREELEKKCIDCFVIKEEQMRDMYAMAECNFIILECENKVKHLPPTVHFSIRNLADPTKEVEDGEQGLIAVLDPSSLSYPAYVLTEDIGTIRKNVKCSCGRTSDVVEILGRAHTPYIKTCALTLEEFIEEKAKQNKV